MIKNDLLFYGTFSSLNVKNNSNQAIDNTDFVIFHNKQKVLIGNPLGFANDYPYVPQNTLIEGCITFNVPEFLNFPTPLNTYTYFDFLVKQRANEIFPLITVIPSFNLLQASTAIMQVHFRGVWKKEAQLNFFYRNDQNHDSTNDLSGSIIVYSV